jgi:hypothetical protein
MYECNLKKNKKCAIVIFPDRCFHEKYTAQYSPNTSMTHTLEWLEKTSASKAGAKVRCEPTLLVTTAADPSDALPFAEDVVLRSLATPTPRRERGTQCRLWCSRSPRFSASTRCPGFATCVAHRGSRNRCLSSPGVGVFSLIHTSTDQCLWQAFRCPGVAQ